MCSEASQGRLSYAKYALGQKHEIRVNYPAEYLGRSRRHLWGAVARMAAPF